MAQRQVEAQAKANEQAKIDALPINRLFRSYQLWAMAKFCNQIREGHMVQYVNDVELERAHAAVKAIEAKATKEDSSINTDDIWKKALREVNGKPATDSMCHAALQQLFRESPESVFSVEKP